jgi:hypothetical protein
MKRPLTEAERKLYEEGRCICCGQPVPRLKPPHAFQPYECKDCWKMSRPPDGERVFGVARALMHREFLKRMGYGSSSSGAPKKVNDDREAEAGDDPWSSMHITRKGGS